MRIININPCEFRYLVQNARRGEGVEWTGQRGSRHHFKVYKRFTLNTPRPYFFGVFIEASLQEYAKTAILHSAIPDSNGVVLYDSGRQTWTDAVGEYSLQALVHAHSELFRFDCEYVNEMIHGELA
jgi:hypothetical protein